MMLCLCARFFLLKVASLAFAGKVNPFSKDSRLAVIGAGPAGIHLASRLKKLGFDKVTLLERSERVGGKSYTIYRDLIGEPCEQERDNITGITNTETCIAFEMGTCFLHNGYHTIRDLVEEYGLTPEIAPEGRAMFSHYASDQWSSQEMSDFVTSAIMDAVNSGVIKRSWWVPAFSETLTVMDALTSAVSKYNELHLQLFGQQEFSFPERLDKQSLAQLNMTFAQFLNDNGLQALAAFLMFAHAAQGYGYVKSIPAFYGLWWITPELLNGYIQMSMHQKIEECKLLAKTSNSAPVRHFVWLLTKTFVGGSAKTVVRTTTMLPEGYAKIWKTIYEKESLDVRFGVEIQNGGIDRQLAQANAGVKVTYRQRGGSWRTEEFDFLVYTGPHAHAAKYVQDLTGAEKSIFDQLQSFVLATTLYQSDAVEDYTEGSVNAPIMYNADKMDNHTMDGAWYADRNDPSIFGDVRRAQGQTRVGYQFFEKYCEFDSVLCDTDRTPDDQQSPRFVEAPKVKERFLQELEIQRVKNVKILEQFSWPYFHHFPLHAVNAGLPWDLVDLQGSMKTWWLGASASFESVHDVTNYNLMILKKYLHLSSPVGNSSTPVANLMNNTVVI
mmetsp:Transcript_82235/g.129453  ORF Transcript_82235/g.129453 Transcript_82235/m.129453 type:complete len:611 (-) Transcript_82235:16-1848(-)